MGIFQEQFNSALRNAVSAKFATTVVKKIDPKPNDFEAQAKALETNPEAQNVHSSLNRLGAQALEEKGVQQRKIQELQRGLDAERARELSIANKLMSQGHAKRTKTLERWHKELTGGNE